jgi:CelD/BcsL family acetyltransferase involved in cellulose biosynthesis
VSLALRRYDPHAQIGEVEAIWRALEAQARPSYFLTWGWIANWLACLPRDEAPSLAVLVDGGAPIAAGFLGARRVRRHRVVPSRALYLNATGVAAHDEICVEHNALLCAPAHHVRIAELIASLPTDWDELFLAAIDRDAFPDLGAAVELERLGVRVRVDREVASPFVDLERVRATPGGYLALLGPGTRAQIRRARRAVGTIDVEVASDWRQARSIYEELVFLHERSWRARGQAGSFADPWFVHFHERLIDARFRAGDIQLVRLRAGSTTIGCLYGLVANGRVLFYQSGLGAFADPHVKPGYLCHAAAVEHAASAGHAVYDLLGGDARYKRCLATDESNLSWIRIQRPRLRFAVEDWLRRWKHALAPQPGRRLTT